MTNYKPYKTPKNAPKCVKYWDKRFKSKPYSFDWQLMRSIVEAKIEEISKELKISIKKSRTVAWNAYCAAIEGDEENPLWEAYQDFLEVIEDEELPEFVMRQTIGSDLHAGHTERAAKTAFIEWLKEDPDNGIFGEYLLKLDLTTVKI